MPLFFRIAKMGCKFVHTINDDQLVVICCQRNIFHPASPLLMASTRSRHACGMLKNPFRSSQLTCGPVYLQVTSPFSSWKGHGTTITVSPSRIHVLFFILPRILHILVTLSRHRTLKWDAPSSFVTVPNISLSAFLGVLTLVTSPPVSPGFLPP